VAALIFFIYDWSRQRGEPKVERSVHKVRDTNDLKSLLATFKEFGLLFWLVMCAEALFTTDLYVFTSYATLFIKDKWGYDQSDAAMITSFVCLANLITAPVTGYLAGRYGKRAYFILGGAAVMTFMHAVFGMTTLHPAITTVCLGLVQSVMDTALLPSISLVVAEQHYGKAYSVTVFAWNVGLFVMPIVVGAAVDRYGLYYANMLFVVMSSISTILGVGIVYINKTRCDNILNKSSLE